MTYRECARAPTKLVLVQKLEAYLGKQNIKIGIDMSKRNFPDKRWLVLAIGSLSKGQDEIFGEDYLPVKSMMSEVMKQLNKPLFNDIPDHLKASGRGRSMKMSGLTKQQKVEFQLQQSQARIAKQVADQEKIKQ